MTGTALDAAAGVKAVRALAVPVLLELGLRPGKTQALH